MKDVKFVTACPDDTYYTWQVHLWLESLKDLGKKWFAFSKINLDVNDLMKKLEGGL
jgi:hypothetical protein